MPIPARIQYRQVIRHMAIRRILTERAGRNGVHSFRELQRLLSDAGYPVAEVTLRNDMVEIGAVKIRDEEYPTLSWWTIPVWNPSIEDLRRHVDPEVVEHEALMKMAMHAIDAVILGNRIHIMTEPRAGYLLSYWISWLRWEGMVDVQEKLDGCIIHCATPEDAIVIRHRLLGNEGKHEEETSQEHSK